MKKSQSIRYKLLLSMLFIFLIFVFIMLIIWYHSLKKQAESTAIANMESAINVANTAFENQVQDIINIESLTTIQTNNSLSTNILNILEQESLTPAEIVAYRRNAKDYLISLCSFQKYLNGLMLSNFNGDTVVYGNPTPYEMIMEHNWLEVLHDSSTGIAFIEPHYQTKWYANKNDLVFSIMKPVLNQSQDEMGFVIADVNCQLFHDSFGYIASNTSLYIVDDNSRNIIYSSGDNILNLNESEQIPEHISEQLNGNSGNFFIKQQNKMYLAVYNKSSLSNWNTINIISEKDILMEFSTAIQHVLIITFILLAIMISLVFGFSSLFTNNIIKLTEAVKEVDENHLSLDIEISSSDEVAALYTQFQSMLGRIKCLLSEIQAKEEEKRNAEIAALQFQMNPHFLYNTLNTIKFLASIQGIENIEKVAELLSNLMHINMDGRSLLFIHEDIHFVECYLELQTYRHTNIFTYDIVASDDIQHYSVPKLFVQPLVENAIMHGLSNKPINGHIQIEYIAVDSVLHIIVEDNGKGITSEKIQEIFSRNQNENAGHIGIYNLQKRIKLYYGDRYDITIQSKVGEYTRCELTLPLSHSARSQENDESFVSR